MAEGSRPRRGCLGAALAALGLAYLLNPTAGVLELLPDNLPLAGNLDEALATLVAVYGLRLLGIDLTRRAGPPAARRLRDLPQAPPEEGPEA